METLKETIRREILDTVHDEDRLRSVLKNRGRSKGPLYLALAEATAEMIERLEKAHEEAKALLVEKDRLHHQVAELEERRGKLGEQNRAASESLSAVELELSKSQSSSPGSTNSWGQASGRTR